LSKAARAACHNRCCSQLSDDKHCQIPVFGRYDSNRKRTFYLPYHRHIGDSGAVFFIEEATFAGFAAYVFYGMIRTIYRVFLSMPEHAAEAVKGLRRRFFHPRHKGHFLGRFRKNKKEQARQ